MGAGGRKIRVLVVDHSASMREIMIQILSRDADIEVMATACDPYVAAAHIAHEVPDVITLDIEMPRMDGITFLRKIMSQRPIPTVICSSLAEAGPDAMFRALEAGAVEVIVKPTVGARQHLLEVGGHIRAAVKAAAPPHGCRSNRN